MCMMPCGTPCASLCTGGASIADVSVAGFDSVKYVGCEGPATLSSVPSITKKHHLNILSTQLAGKNFVWDIFRAKTELQKHSIGKWSSFKYCTVWSV